MGNTTEKTPKKERMGLCVPYSLLTEEEKDNYVEPNIKPLVEVLNGFEGVDTFASCEGHIGDYVDYNGTMNAYVGFQSTNVSSVEKIIECLLPFDGISNKVRQKLSCDITCVPEYRDGLNYYIRFYCDHYDTLVGLLKSAAEAIKEGKRLKPLNKYGN